MDAIFSNLMLGFDVALTPTNIMWVFIGGLLGKVLGGAGRAIGSQATGSAFSAFLLPPRLGASIVPRQIFAPQRHSKRFFRASWWMACCKATSLEIVPSFTRRCRLWSRGLVCVSSRVFQGNCSPD